MIIATPQEYRILLDAFGALRPGEPRNAPRDAGYGHYRTYLSALRRWVNEEQGWPAEHVLADLDRSPHVERP
jgi:hypothetical protein